MDLYILRVNHSVNWVDSDALAHKSTIEGT